MLLWRVRCCCGVRQKLMGRVDAIELLQEFDTDGSGTLDREELRAGFGKIGEAIPAGTEEGEALLSAVMALLDRDGDGMPRAHTSFSRPATSTTIVLKA